MRPGYTLSGKKITTTKPTSFSLEILYALNRKQAKNKTKVFEGVDASSMGRQLHRKKTRAAKKARKTRGNR